MNRNKRVIMSVIWVVIGSVLVCLSFMGKVDEYWSGCGSSLLVIGILQLLRFRRFQKDLVYRESIEIEERDERNSFIRNKAWAWTGYIFVLLTAISSVVLRIMGEEYLSVLASFIVCMVLLIFWSSYMLLKRKY